MMTAFGTPDVISGATRLGVYRVVNQPVDMDEMLALVSGSIGYPPAAPGTH